MKNTPVLLQKIAQRNTLQEILTSAVVKELSPDELEEFERFISYSLSLGLTLDYLADSYDLIVSEAMEEMRFFRKHRRYRFSSYEEVASAVYANADYMNKYMDGLALTTFLWPNHVRMKRYFFDSIPKTKRGRYLEIGPGHGFYFMSALRLTQYDTFEGVDVSPTSVDMTNRIVASDFFGHFESYRIFECDALNFDFEGQFDAIVMGEVLEHVETPKTLLERLRALLKPDGFAFLTTCINAPAFDHIFHFTSVEHLESIIQEARLSIRDKLILPYNETTLEISEKKALPVNVAYVLATA